MPTVRFTPNLERHVAVPPCEVSGETVGEVLDAVFHRHPRARDYVLDEGGAVRHHMVVFVDGRQIEDLAALSDPLRPVSEIYVMQALSGG